MTYEGRYETALIDLRAAVEAYLKVMDRIFDLLKMGDPSTERARQEILSQLHDAPEIRALREAEARAYVDDWPEGGAAKKQP